MPYAAAHEASPNKVWLAFLNPHRTLVTSWLRQPLYQVDFVDSGQRSRYVHAIMPAYDGMVQVEEAGVDEGGIDISLYLHDKAKERLLLERKLQVAVDE
ncbi:hypothetical protein POX_a00568 [Penicillium oxalicum]|uniref:hypothetical protein n=1 Tax=Penicillium oxalicum TaxID=69781 RepID=UPI0020B89F39|nr:hypothetical protein POX_a00568 [Penicillium oxalicum]KAI2793978.1 hypothetical protein POX_a00568 [Penicillium oxalicum]